MRTLKEQLRRDLEGVFFNATELSSLHELEGVLLQAVVGRHTSEMSGRLGDHYAGLHGDHISIQFRTSDFLRKNERLPCEGEEVKLDGSIWTVSRSQDEYGGARLELEHYRGVQAP